MPNKLNWDKYPNFTKSEFTCSCGCGRADMDPQFMAELQVLRSLYAHPMRITSGYRCKNHVVERKKSRPGAHTLGKAADVAMSTGMNTHEFLLVVFKHMKFSGVGVNRKSGGGGFVHLDMATKADGFSRPTMWTY